MLQEQLNICMQEKKKRKKKRKTNTIHTSQYVQKFSQNESQI